LDVSGNNIRHTNSAKERLQGTLPFTTGDMVGNKSLHANHFPELSGFKVQRIQRYAVLKAYNSAQPWHDYHACIDSTEF